MGEGIKIQRRIPILDTNLYIYKDGDEKTALTGGFELNYTNAGYQWYKQPASLQLIYASGAYPGAYFTTSSAINLTNYSTLNFSCNFSNTYTGLWLGANATKVTAWIESANAYTAPVTTGAQTFSVNVASLNGSYYIFGRAGAGASSGSNGHIYKIWLEV